MVWDGEARSLNEALHLLQVREGSRDRWYSIRGPPSIMHLSADDFGCVCICICMYVYM